MEVFVGNSDNAENGGPSFAMGEPLGISQIDRYSDSKNEPKSVVKLHLSCWIIPIHIYEYPSSKQPLVSTSKSVDIH